MTIAPNFVDAVLLLAEIHIRAGAAQPAIEDLERLLARQPKAAAALVLLGGAMAPTSAAFSGSMPWPRAR